MTLKRRLLPLLAVALAAVPAVALAGPVTLRANPVDHDGRVTLGDIFEDAGAAAGVVVGTRSGPAIVFDAGQLQTQALRAGLVWSNPQRFARVVVRATDAAPTQGSVQGASSSRTTAGAQATVDVLTYARNLSTGEIVRPEDVVWTSVQAHMAPSGAPTDADQVIGLATRRSLRAGSAVSARDVTAPQVIARNDMVEVAFISEGVKLTVTGRATRNAAAGEAVPILNLQSNRTIDAVAVAPGRAVAGPAAHTARDMAVRNPSSFAAR